MMDQHHKGQERAGAIEGVVAAGDPDRVLGCGLRRYVRDGLHASFLWTAVFAGTKFRDPLLSTGDLEDKGMSILKWALIFLVVSIIAGLLGFTGVSAASADIARVLFYIFVVIFLVLLILGLTIFRV
jgi:uncharacterized membrane protein YtjA (UPF0391 family)